MSEDILGRAIVNTQSNITTLGILKNLEVSGISTFSSIYSSNLNIPNVDIKTFDISIGNQAGFSSQQTNSIAIGYQAGYTNQGTNSIAIGYQAGMTNQQRNSIVINATNSGINGVNSNSTFIAPIRNITQTNILGYNSTNNEISYFNLGGGGAVLQMAFFRLSTTVSVGNNVQFVIKYNTTVFNDISNLTHNTTTGVFNIGSTGLYTITYVNRWATGNNDRQSWIFWSVYNTTFFSRTWVNSLGGANTVINSQFSFVATTTNSTIQVIVVQNSGGSLALQGEAQGAGQGTYILFTRVA